MSLFKDFIAVRMGNLWYIFNHLRPLPLGVQCIELSLAGQLLLSFHRGAASSASSHVSADDDWESSGSKAEPSPCRPGFTCCQRGEKGRHHQLK